jgi:hypothetical protein
MVAALAVPRLLDGVVTDRTATMVGAGLLMAGLLFGPLVANWPMPSQAVTACRRAL